MGVSSTSVAVCIKNTLYVALSCPDLSSCNRPDRGRLSFYHIVPRDLHLSLTKASLRTILCTQTMITTPKNKTHGRRASFRGSERNPKLKPPKTQFESGFEQNGLSRNASPILSQIEAKCTYYTRGPVYIRLLYSVWYHSTLSGWWNGPVQRSNSTTFIRCVKMQPIPPPLEQYSTWLLISLHGMHVFARYTIRKVFGW